MSDTNQNNQVNTENQNGLVVRADVESLFSGDSYGLFVFKKTEKIVTAIYLLTGVMSEKEPMKERMRTIATDMLATAFAMSDRIWGEEVFQKNLSGSIHEIVTLFDIAEKTKMVSKMNHDIITTELKKMLDFLVTSALNYSSAKIAIEPGLFDGDYNYVSEKRYQNQPVEQKVAASNEHKGQVILKDMRQNNVEKIAKAPAVARAPKDNNRQEVITGMLKDGSKLTIKDFAKNIKGCSEKTIQRELITMVSKGLLKKEGERRWSKYFIA
ncbi:MAG: hypothetical protein WCX27_00300 [Candidatus Paceibacterota bacterium]|jgi:hypothetical protein